MAGKEKPADVVSDATKINEERKKRKEAVAKESLGHMFDQLIDLNSVMDLTLDQEEELVDRSPAVKKRVVQDPTPVAQPSAIPNWLQGIAAKPLQQVPA